MFTTVSKVFCVLAVGAAATDTNNDKKTEVAKTESGGILSWFGSYMPTIGCGGVGCTADVPERRKIANLPRQKKAVDSDEEDVEAGRVGDAAQKKDTVTSMKPKNSQKRSALGDAFKYANAPRNSKTLTAEDLGFYSQPATKGQSKKQRKKWQKQSQKQFSSHKNHHRGSKSKRSKRIQQPTK